MCWVMIDSAGLTVVHLCCQQHQWVGRLRIVFGSGGNGPIVGSPDTILWTRKAKAAFPGLTKVVWHKKPRNTQSGVSKFE